LREGKKCIAVQFFEFYLKADVFPFDNECESLRKTIQSVIDYWFTTLRYVSNFVKLKPFEIYRTFYDINFTSDDGEPITIPDLRLIRRVNVLYYIITNEMWNEATQIPYEYSLPQWKITLLDSRDLVNNPGSALVLAFSSLEIYINELLIKHVNLFENEQNKYRYLDKIQNVNTNIYDKFCTLSKKILGFSLKKNDVLFNVFKNIKEARNCFIHNGTLIFNRTEITPVSIVSIINKIESIIHFYEVNINEEYRTKIYEIDNANLQIDLKPEFINY
jgi:hypothetical protein